jgi:hypothetical protein
MHLTRMAVYLQLLIYILFMNGASEDDNLCIYEGQSVDANDIDSRLLAAESSADDFSQILKSISVPHY